MSEKLSREILSRRAIVYVRQSTTAQLVENVESRRRQYALADRARELGFRAVEVVDDDLGRSGSGLAERPGFQRVVAALCTGDIGAVLSIEASRLARNGRDWQHLVDLCGLVGALIIDADGIYDPRIINDRLLLGLKGTMSEFELSLIRQRSLEALRSKARRGELRFCLPVGFSWSRDDKIELDPDTRIRDAVGLVFRKLEELGSGRQVLLWFRREGVSLPRMTSGRLGTSLEWALPSYNTIHGILTNPIYAGAYAYGKTEARTRVVDGRARRTQGHMKTRDRWSVLIRGHHSGYITWERFEANQVLLSENAHMKKRISRKSGRGGRALLSGLLRCRRCGRMLHVAYGGIQGRVVRYHCRGAQLNHGTSWCISVGGLRIDRAVGAGMLRAVEGKTIEAAIEAAERAAQKQQALRRAIELELEQARYEAQLAARRYDSVDPSNRLVAGELELRWNRTLDRVAEVERRLAATPESVADRSVDRERLLRLAVELPAIWDAESTDMRLKQRIVHLLIEEIVVDVDDAATTTVLTIHWAGGRHSELRVARNAPGRHGRCTDEDAVDIVRRMAGGWNDEQIASTLNRLGMRTGAGNTWSPSSVYMLRHRLGLKDAARADTAMLTLEQAARRLSVSPTVVRRLIADGLLKAAQVVKCAPWAIAAEAMADPRVVEAARARSERRSIPRIGPATSKNLTLPGV